MLWFYVLSIHVWWLRLELFALIEVGGRDWDGKGTTCDEGCDCMCLAGAMNMKAVTLVWSS